MRRSFCPAPVATPLRGYLRHALWEVGTSRAHSPLKGSDGLRVDLNSRSEHTCQPVRAHVSAGTGMCVSRYGHVCQPVRARASARATSWVIWYGPKCTTLSMLLSYGPSTRLTTCSTCLRLRALPRGQPACRAARPRRPLLGTPSCRGIPCEGRGGGQSEEPWWGGGGRWWAVAGRGVEQWCARQHQKRQ